ncbi:hypothetical protein A1O3_06037 [Capronia epimyces CBS 606.96]|uniref:Transcription factor domain-containing protein n=1 Tax=Capronia epimyces CBS 606.96 TaxID=1182542 RepID=W9YIV3_9EURO|nr:uncharacterized protein A1O3_06037 [Capronia epimyces CBS 606.96]EXJ82224.1 hypothetical protein A1O3_06037 [Capronia epimyces CBS 606.96]
MSHLCRFFIANLLIHIPILTEQDVGDYETMVKAKKRLLACAMVYVAARYVPGCKTIQTMLLADILTIIKPLPHGCDEETRWTNLQALAVLYNWAVPLDLASRTDSDRSNPVLQYDALRAPIETVARQCSLHRAAEDLATSLEQHHNDLDVHQTIAFRKYLFWLWLFGVVHLRSLWARSPPSIQPDSSIRSCRRLLQNHFHDDQVRRILSQVELCLIWTHPTHREWWCSLPSENDLESTLAVLKDMDEALESWRRTWFPPDQTRSNKSQSHTIDFQYCFSRLCVSAYVTKLHQLLASARTSPLVTLSLITKTIERASQFSRLFLGLRPLSKSVVRFGPEDTFAMLTLGCHYVLCAHRLLADADIVKPGHLSIVRSMAELMVELGIDSKHSGRVYGESLLGSLPPQLQATQPNTSYWHASPSQPPELQSPEVERTVSASSKVWTCSQPVNAGPPGSRQLFEVAAALDQVWPFSAVSMRDKHTPLPRTALWTSGETGTQAGQQSQQPMAVAPSATGPDVIGLGFDYDGSAPLIYAPGDESISYTT